MTKSHILACWKILNRNAFTAVPSYHQRCRQRDQTDGQIVTLRFSFGLCVSVFSLLTAYERCATEAEKEKLLSSVRYGKLKRFVVSFDSVCSSRIWSKENKLVNALCSVFVFQKLGSSSEQNSVPAVLHSGSSVIETLLHSFISSLSPVNTFQSFSLPTTLH